MPLGQDSGPDSRTADLKLRSPGRGIQDLLERVSDIQFHNPTEAMGQASNRLALFAKAFPISGIQSDQVPATNNYTSMFGQGQFLSPDQMSDIMAVRDIFSVLRVFKEDYWVQRALASASGENTVATGLPIDFNRISRFFAGRLRLEERDFPVSVAELELLSRLSLAQVSNIDDISDVCEVLHIWGEHDLAGRIAYFASDEDLEDGDIPVTPEITKGFLSFFGSVKSEGRVSLTCSPEGWLCAVWRFPDNRRASLWFLDTNRVMFAATNADGDFIEIDGGGEVGNARVVMEKLIQAGLLTWDSDTPNSGSFQTFTMWPDTVESGTSQRMGFQQRMPSASARTRTNVTSPQTGWSTSTASTDDSRLTASSNL